MSSHKIDFAVTPKCSTNSSSACETLVCGYERFCSVVCDYFDMNGRCDKTHENGQVSFIRTCRSPFPSLDLYRTSVVKSGVEERSCWYKVEEEVIDPLAVVLENLYRVQRTHFSMYERIGARPSKIQYDLLTIPKVNCVPPYRVRL